MAAFNGVKGTAMRVAVLGLGEAGATIAADLVAAGARVSGWDPAPGRTLEGVVPADGPDAAVAAADVVLSVNSQAVAVTAAEGAAPALTPAHLYADLNTTSAAVKRAVEAVVDPTGAAFADIALMAPVPGRGVRTPALASGRGADRFAAAFTPIGMPVESIGGAAGDAATRKLLRSIVMKGLGTAVVESMTAAEAAGCAEWLRGEIGAIFEGADAGLLDRLLTGSRAHARRREAEMEAAAALERDLGVEPHIAAAAANVLRAIRVQAT
jgi:3-hydroxyisobutyrate dehydrogenase-like beta-hydroxyacid dehydrogenase